MIVVRAAQLGDAEAIAEIHVRAWQQTYRHLVDVGRLDALDPADRVERWRETVLGSDESVWVGLLDGAPAGWATASEREHPRQRELNGMYTLASAHGSGVGQALLQASLGDAPAFLWVAADNPRAQAFYRKNGFSPDGETGTHDLLGSSVAIERWVR